MKLTVDDILHYPEFSGLHLLAGAGGVSNQVSSCGILDYEYDKTLKNKYTKLSFIPNQLILSSLQYAKEAPGCLIDAIRLLHHKQCSCLVIKNVYGLPLAPHILRYADSANFPIIVIRSSEQYFERIIVNVYKRLQSLHDFDKFEQLVATILALPEHDPIPGKRSCNWKSTRVCSLISFVCISVPSIPYRPMNTKNWKKRRQQQTS
ncbi:PucR family transcriptional regulator ligand-binding domain-containing protein [uncultured Megasphaera sp.]|uniref:PucR family transcriptional regulator ligand-binding domain-containing protein n=1 Tax=uncultured Megasphaera sp. TaxID=165188 RepID=UPI002591AC5F|nr:PucR family transcriptional regulator ligand-binding domain-containing protein [uncultured Megasphaera sp.]